MTDSNVTVLGDLPRANIIVIYMRRGESAEKKLESAFGKVDRVVIDVEGEQHEYDADTLIRLLEELEGGDEA